MKLWRLGSLPVFFAHQPNGWTAVSNPGAGNQILQLRVHVHVHVHVHVNMHYYAIFMHRVCTCTCTCTRMHYAAIHVTCVLFLYFLFLYIKAIVNNSHISKWLKRSSDRPIKWFTADQIEKREKEKKELCMFMQRWHALSKNINAPCKLFM